MSMQEYATLTKDNLFAGTQVMPVVSDKMTIAVSQTLTRGALLDKDGSRVSKTVSGETTTYSDVYAVLAEDVTTDASNTKMAAVYLTGEFNAAALSVTTTNTATVDEFKVSARKVGIFIKEAVSK